MNNLFKNSAISCLMLLMACLQISASSKEDIGSVYLLEEAPTAIISCGNIAYAVALKLREVKGNDTGKIIIGIIRCPDTYGPNFFTKSAHFMTDLSSDTTALKLYTVYDPYKKLGIATFLTTKISRI